MRGDGWKDDKKVNCLNEPLSPSLSVTPAAGTEEVRANAMSEAPPRAFSMLELELVSVVEDFP